MAHTYDLNLYTYFDVKINPEAVDQVLASTQRAASADNGSLAGVEYLGHVGQLDNHLLYRVPRHNLERNNNAFQPPSAAAATTQGPQGPQSLHDEEQEQQRNMQIIDAITAVQGVIHVDVQALRQRHKRDEL
ncbi:hypothetical protein EDD11_007580 [Mortierella claussenii]|nr:hypothetical protein EDD11_007580 [Mortierella claussenii]